MSLLALFPEKYRDAVKLLADTLPIIECSIKGHDPLPLVAGRRVVRNDEGVKQIRCCARCKLAYWEEPT